MYARTPGSIWTDCPIFLDLDRVAIEGALEKAVRSSVLPYTCLCKAGESAAWFYLILRGEVNYYWPSQDGTEILIRVLSTHDCFGLGAFLAKPQPYLGTARTLTFCEILKWRHSEIAQLVKRYPQLSRNAMRIMVERPAESHAGDIGFKKGSERRGSRPV